MKLLLIMIIPMIKSLIIPPPSCSNCKFYKPHSYDYFDSTSFSRCTYYGVDKYVDVVRSDDNLCGITGKNYVKEKYIGIKKLKQYISSNKFGLFALSFVINHIFILFKEAFGKLH
jgi:hypothetical protein